MTHLFVSFIILSILLLCVNLLIPSILQKKLKWVTFGGVELAACLALLTYSTYNLWLAILVLVLLLTLTVLYIKQQLFNEQAQGQSEVEEEQVEDKPAIELEESTKQELEQIVNDEEISDPKQETGLSFAHSDMNQEAIDEQVATMLEEQEDDNGLDPSNEKLQEEQASETNTVYNEMESESLERDRQFVEQETIPNEQIDEPIEIAVDEDLLADRSQLEDIPDEIDDEEALLASRKWMLDEIEVEQENPNEKVPEKSPISTLDDEILEEKISEAPIDIDKRNLEAEKQNQTNLFNDLKELEIKQDNETTFQESKQKSNKKIVLQDLNLSDTN